MMIWKTKMEVTLKCFFCLFGNQKKLDKRNIPPDFEEALCGAELQGMLLFLIFIAL